MTITAAPERKPRCRYHNRRDDPCPNEVIDPDPGAPQICVRHAFEGTQLLADSGAITFRFATPTARKRSA
ncbi:MAG: hypothetical protein ACRDP6_42120 [Actinoallomurus sp.]